MLRTKLTSTSGIYQIQSKINGKIYIGSAVNLKRRKSNHIHKLKIRKHHTIHLQNHVNKYGIDDLEFGIIKFCHKEKLIELEQYYIDKLWPEFNICKVAGSSLGIIPTEKLKQQLRNTLSNPIDQYSLDGKFIASYSSRREASRQTGFYMAGITSCVSGKTIISNNYFWVKKGECIDKKIKEFNNRFLNNRVKVNQYTLKGIFITTFPSLKDAAKEIGTGYQNIWSNINKKSKSAGGFIWKLN